jgi:acetyl/propionyl-CoA carboxylase alpha subunit
VTFEVEVGDRTIPVSVERMDGPRRFRVTVAGVSRVVDVVRPNEFTLALLATSPDGRVPAGDASGREKGTADAVRTPSDFQFAPGGAAGELLVGLEGRTIKVTVNGRRSAHADAGAHGHGQVTIAAPMPGRVVRVLVAAGDEVAARQGVVVVEAMKMENELKAPRAGRVKEVSVTAGTSVEAGRILAVIE